MIKTDGDALRIYEYIRSRIDTGVSPTVREICSDLGFHSTSTVHRLLSQLEVQGYIMKNAGQRRTIALANASVRQVPIMGVVAAGNPLLAVEHYEGFVAYSGRAAGELFAIRVKGESMMDAGILNGDIIVVSRTTFAENGDIVVALLEEEATVKRFFKEKGHYRLQPENTSMEPIYAREVLILGKVVAVVRNYE